MTLVLPTKLRRGPCLIEMEWILPEILFLTLYHHPTRNTKTSSFHMVPNNPWNNFELKNPMGIYWQKIWFLMNTSLCLFYLYNNNVITTALK